MRSTDGARVDNRQFKLMGLYPGTDVFPNTSLWPEEGGEVPPTATTGDATAITATGATFGGTVDPNGLQAHFYFEYGLSDGYGSQTSEGIAGSGVSGTAVYKTVNDLLGARYYHFRLVAYSSAGFAYGEDATFYTLAGRDDRLLGSLVHEANRSQ